MTQTAVNYGNALYELARNEQLDGEIYAQYGQVLTLLRENPAYLRLLSEPSVAKQERCQLLQEAFGGKLHAYLLNFLKLLCEHGDIRQYADCYTQYRKRYNADRGIVEATAVTAVALPEALREKLLQKLQAITGKQIELRVRVDASVLGGIRLQMDGRQFDGTVRAQLDEMRRTLNDTVL